MWHGFFSINLSSRNLIDNEHYDAAAENQTELRDDIDERELHGSIMEHPGSWDGVLTISVEEDRIRSTSVTGRTSLVRRILDSSFFY